MAISSDEHKPGRTGLRYLSVCSGIEAATVAWHPLGFEPCGFCEIGRFPSSVLKHHYPDIPNYGDFTAIDLAALGEIDLLVGGTPCQAFSFAGKRRSLADARGNLSLAYANLVHELARSHDLRWVVWENVPGVLSTSDNAFGCLLGMLVGGDDALCLPAGFERWPDIGMVAGPRARAAWRVLDAQYFGLPQRRRRVFLVAGFGDRRDPAAVLFERKSLHWHPGKGENTRQDFTEAFGPRAPSGGGVGSGDGLIQEREIMPAMTTRTGTGVGQGGMDDYVIPLRQELIGQAILSNQGSFNTRSDCGPEEPHNTLTAQGKPNAVALQMRRSVSAVGAFTATEVRIDRERNFFYAVRRLTPRECERLQGFPDDYTLISAKTPDGSRYKALGNSMAVPVMRWLGERIARINAAGF